MSVKATASGVTMARYQSYHAGAPTASPTTQVVQSAGGRSTRAATMESSRS